MKANLTSSLLSLLLSAASPTLARAGSPSAQPAPQQARTGPAAQTGPAQGDQGAGPGAAAASDLNFDLLDEGKKPDAVQKAQSDRLTQALDQQVKLRRRLLTAHQIFGFTTLAALATTVIIGQLNYLDKYGGGEDNGRFQSTHLGLGITTTALFATTGLLAVFAPNPYPKPRKFDTAFLHKLSMGLATAGMVAQMVLGPVAGAREGHLDQRPIAQAHLGIGYATWALMATGTIAYLF